MRYTIYGLYDPREPDCIRYIGFSADPEKRLRAHIAEAKRSQQTTHKLSWLRALLRDGIRPAWSVLSQTESLRDAAIMEIAEINRHRCLGVGLTNGTNGGDGSAEWTPARRESRSDISRRLWTNERREQHKVFMAAFYKTSEGQGLRVRQKENGKLGKRLQVYSEESRVKMRLAKLGKPGAPRNAEWKAKLAVSNSGKKHNMTAEGKARHAAAMGRDETRAKMSASAKARWARSRMSV